MPVVNPNRWDGSERLRGSEFVVMRNDNNQYRGGTTNLTVSGRITPEPTGSSRRRSKGREKEKRGGVKRRISRLFKKVGEMTGTTQSQVVDLFGI